MSFLDGLVADLNKVIDNRDVATAVTTAAALGVCGGTILMVDESGQSVPAAWKPNPVGMVIFAVVANNAFAASVSTDATFQIPQGGYSAVGVGGLYRQAADGRVPYVAVGRTAGSGTALEFGKWPRSRPVCSRARPPARPCRPSPPPPRRPGRQASATSAARRRCSTI
jgi:hypothetical protein